MAHAKDNRPSARPHPKQPTGSGRRRLIWATLALLLPLIALVLLQVRWLRDLERTSALAGRAALAGYLDRVAKEVRFFYTENAERVLNLPAAVLEPRLVHKIGRYISGAKVKGARRIFVVNFLARGEERTLLFDPCSGDRLEPRDDELRAIYMATAPWNVVLKKGGKIETKTLSVEERDPEHRILLKPIVGDDGGIAGIAGMILDPEEMLTTVLPRAIADVIPEKARERLEVEVRTPEDRYAFGERQGTSGKINRPLGFAFSDWQLVLSGEYAQPEKWAQDNVANKLIQLALLAAVLLGSLLLMLRTLAREMRLARMKSDFVSNVSHELRTPLASIRVFGELLGLGRVTSAEKARRYGKYIESESRRLTQLINNILDFSHIESGHKIYTFGEADLGELAQDVLQTFEASLRRSGVEARLSPEEPPRLPVEIDTSAMHQALCNLLDNALKYSNGSHLVEIFLEREGQRAVVRVRDHGIGIASDEQKKIFERFHRVGNSTIHDVKGTGLGLSIVQHIVAAHRGEITVESALGHGSTFSIALPLVARESDEPATATGALQPLPPEPVQ